MATRSQEEARESWCASRKTEEDQSRRARYGNFSKAPKRRDVDDDFSLVRHDVPFQSWVGPEEMTDRVNICTTLRAAGRLRRPSQRPTRKWELERYKRKTTPFDPEKSSGTQNT